MWFCQKDIIMKRRNALKTIGASAIALATGSLLAQEAPSHKLYILPIDKKRAWALTVENEDEFLWYVAYNDKLVIRLKNSNEGRQLPQVCDTRHVYRTFTRGRLFYQDHIYTNSSVYRLEIRLYFDQDDQPMRKPLDTNHPGNPLRRYNSLLTPSEGV